MQTDGEEDSESAEEEADEEDEDEDAMGRTSDLESSGDEDEEEPKALKSPVKVQKVRCFPSLYTCMCTEIFR